MKYLPKYFAWLEAGKIPYVEAEYTDGGLCSIFGKDKMFALMKPEPDLPGYWGDDVHVWPEAEPFTPLRQTIVLFMAAMNGEL